VDLAQGAIGTRFHDLLFHPRMTLTIDVRWIGATLFGPLLGGLFKRRRASVWSQQHQVSLQHPEAFEEIYEGEDLTPATAWYYEGEGSSSSTPRSPSPLRSPSPVPADVTTTRLPSPAPEFGHVAAADPPPSAPNHALPWQQSHYSEPAQHYSEPVHHHVEPAQNNVLYSSSPSQVDPSDGVHDDGEAGASIEAEDEPAVTYEAYMAMRAKKEG
jgi:hypothetical protein